MVTIILGNFFSFMHKNGTLHINIQELKYYEAMHKGVKEDKSDITN